MLVLLSFTLRGGKGRNADANAENVAKMTLFCCCLVNLFLSNPPFCRMKRGSKGRVEWGLHVHHQMIPLAELSRSQPAWPLHPGLVTAGLGSTIYQRR